MHKQNEQKAHKTDTKLTHGATTMTFMHVGLTLISQMWKKKSASYSSQTYNNILYTVLTSLRTRFLYVKGAVDISQCLSCKVHLQSV